MKNKTLLCETREQMPNTLKNDSQQSVRDNGSDDDDNGDQ